MQSLRANVVFSINLVRFIPHVLIYFFHPNKQKIKADVKSGIALRCQKYTGVLALLYLLTFSKAFRNIFYYRVQPLDFFLNIIAPGRSTLIFNFERVGEGFVISHGFATAIGAKSIGKNCTIFQQVTIGAATKFGSPTIKDNVVIYAGAIIIGNVTIGNNVVIGANATVYTNVPDNCTVLAGTSKVMKWKK